MIDIHPDHERLIRFVERLSCCCEAQRCSRCQALYGAARVLYPVDPPVRGFGEIEQDPDEAAANLLALELARLKREIAELKTRLT